MPPFSRQRPWQTGEGVGGWGVASAWALLAALAFGETFLARVDAVLLLVPIGAYFLILRFSRVWRREHWIFFGVFAALLVHAAAHAWFFARGYVLYSYMHVLRTQDIGKRPLLLIAPALAALVVLFVLDFFAPRWMPRVTALGEKYWRVLVWGVLGVMVLGSAYAYLIAPHVTTLQAYFGGLMPPSRGANLVKLGWYVSPIGMGLALLGACVFLVRDLKKENVFFAGTALLFSVFYLDQLYSNPHYIYTFRHYIPLTLPAFLIFAARGVEFLWRGERWKPLGKLVAASALALWLIYNAYAMGLYDFTRATGLALRVPGLDAPTRIGGVQLEPFDQSIVGHTELGGAFDQVAAIAQQFDPRTVLIFAANRDDPGLLTVPLRFLYDRDPLNVRFNQPNGVTIGGVIEQLRAQGRDVLVLYGVNGGRLHLPDFKLTRVGEFTFETQQWAFAYDYMPRGAWTLNLHYTVFRPEPADAAGTPYPFRVEFAHGDEPYLAGGFLDVNDVAPNTRWVGKGALAKMPKNLTARLRLPLNTAAREQGVTVSLTARSPRPRDAASGVVQIKSGDTTVASAQLPDEWQTLVFQIPAEELNVQGDSFLLDLDINSFRDPVTGRVLGLELKEIVVR